MRRRLQPRISRIGKHNLSFYIQLLIARLRCCDILHLLGLSCSLLTGLSRFQSPQVNVAVLGSTKDLRFTGCERDGRAGDREARAAAGRITEDDGHCVTYRQRACDLQTTVRSADGNCPGIGLQRNLRTGQSDHLSVGFGPFPGGLARPRHRRRTRRWIRTSLWSSRSSRAPHTTQEECGAGKDADKLFCIHRLILF
jgi:hypothetical protein